MLVGGFVLSPVKIVGLHLILLLFEKTENERGFSHDVVTKR